MSYPLLLTPIQIGNLTIPNRIVMPPMGIYQAGDDGLANQAHYDHYKNSSGPGLVIVESSAVLPDAKVSNRQLGIYSDRHIEGLAKLAQIIKANGAIAGIQLVHAGASGSKVQFKNKYHKYAAILFHLIKQQLMISELDRIRNAFRDAARRAVEAGYDVIELHSAHNKLFSQFLSPLFNWRIDRYGGSIENRRRLLLDVYQAVKQEVAGRALITCRLGIVDKSSRGLSFSDGISTASILEKEGMELLDVSYGSGIPNHVQPYGSQYSESLHLARKAKSELKIPVIGGGGIRHPDLAEQALQDKMADLVFVGRGLLADPAWARKAIKGKPESIVPCKKCKKCFFYSDASLCPARRNQ